MRIYSPPKLIRNYFDDFIWTSEKGKILLTFDDSPNPGTTELILSFLNTNSINALFFCIGNRLIKHSGLAKEIIEEGHTLGAHSFTHKKNYFLNKNILREIDCTNIAAEKMLNYRLKYFRPPYGRFDWRIKNALANRNMKMIMWSLLTYDYQNDLNIVKFSVSKYLRNNSIIVFHDNQKSKLIIIDSLKYLLNEVDRKGYEIGEPAECLK